MNIGEAIDAALGGARILAIKEGRAPEVVWLDRANGRWMTQAEGRLAVHNPHVWGNLLSNPNTAAWTFERAPTASDAVEAFLDEHGAQDGLATARPLFQVSEMLPVYCDECGRGKPQLECRAVHRFFLRRHAKEFIEAHKHNLTDPVIHTVAGPPGEWDFVMSALRELAELRREVDRLTSGKR